MSAITQEYLQKIIHYNPDTGIFTWIAPPGKRTYAGDIAGRKTCAGYIQIGISGKYYQAHRLAWLYVHGVHPAEEIDHVNLDKTDNRIINLREASRAENSRNQATPKTNTSGIKGVSWDKRRRKWRAECVANGKHNTLGYFSEIGAAEIVVKEFREKHHGQFYNHGNTSHKTDNR